jgi:hypothetical protein
LDAGAVGGVASWRRSGYWGRRLTAAAGVIDALAALDLHYPKVSKEKLGELAEAKKMLLAEK